jgi:hypothetical protein
VAADGFLSNPPSCHPGRSWQLGDVTLLTPHAHWRRSRYGQVWRAILGQCSANVQHCLTLFNTIHHTFISDSSSATAHAPRTPRRTILLLLSLLSALMLSLSLCNAGIVASGSIWVGFSFILSMSRGISLLFSLLIMDDGWLPYAATI